jgi:hypothetical protein
MRLLRAESRESYTLLGDRGPAHDQRQYCSAYRMIALQSFGSRNSSPASPFVPRHWRRRLVPTPRLDGPFCYLGEWLSGVVGPPSLRY